MGHDSRVVLGWQLVHSSVKSSGACDCESKFELNLRSSIEFQKQPGGCIALAVTSAVVSEAANVRAASSHSLEDEMVHNEWSSHDAP